MHAPTAFFDKTYDEAFALLIEARDYVAGPQLQDRAGADIWCRARIAFETTRLTSRLGHIMAWLLARKAVHAGELTPAQAAHPPYVLERNELLAADAAPVPAELPPRLESLVVRSHKLYVRVARLDELVRRDATAN